MSDGVLPGKTVVVFFGLIASGKSFLARAWARKHGFPYCNTDVERKRLAGLPSTGAAPKGAGIYSPAFSRLTYDALLDFVDAALDDPEVSWVVLDGSYRTEMERTRVIRRCAQRAKVFFVMCSCSEEVTKTRLAARAHDPAAVSDGTWEVYLRQKDLFEYPEELAVEQFRRLDTDRPLDMLINRLDLIFPGAAGDGSR